MARASTTLSPARLLDKLLLHGQVTRRQIGEGFGISKVAASKQVDWLKRHQVAHSLHVRTGLARRPVEVLQVNDGLATALAIELSSVEVRAELVGASAQSLHTSRWPVVTPRQCGVLGALRQALQWANQAMQRRERIDLVGLSVTGYLEPTSGMIFKVAGVEDWEPCHLGDVVADLHDVTTLPWTSVSCRLRGLSKHLGVDHRLGYIAFSGSSLAIATLGHGAVAMGRFGTGGGAVHQQVSADPTLCLCGRTGCLYEHLRRGTASEEMVRTVLPAILSHMNVTTLGIEWRGETDMMLQACRRAGVTQVHVIDNPGELDRSGLRLACARALLQAIVNRVRPRRERRVVNHDAFRGLVSAEPAAAPATL